MRDGENNDATGDKAMSQERAALLMLKGTISELDQDKQAEINTAKLDIVETMEAHDEGAAQIALSLIMMELVIDSE
jgi:hypothetical protein